VAESPDSSNPSPQSETSVQLKSDSANKAIQPDRLQLLRVAAEVYNTTTYLVASLRQLLPDSLQQLQQLRFHPYIVTLNLLPRDATFC